MLNKASLIGNLGRDPETRYLESGKAVCNFSIATTERWKDKQGTKQERTEWHNIVVFDKLAEICQQYLHKGKQVYIEGKLQTRKWTDKNDVERYSTEIVARDMQMLGTKGDDGGNRQQSGNSNRGQSNQSNNNQGNQQSNDYADDNLPF